MADIDIRELVAYEPYCADCGEAGPIELVHGLRVGAGA